MTAILESTIFGITSLQGSFVNTACSEFIINEWLLTGKINNLNEDDFLQINKLSKKRFGKEKFNKLINLVKENPITYNDTMLDRIRFEMSIIELQIETCVAYGHVIKKVLKAIYFITKNDVPYDPI